MTFLKYINITKKASCLISWWRLVLGFLQNDVDWCVSWIEFCLLLLIFSRLARSSSNSLFCVFISLLLQGFGKEVNEPELEFWICCV